MSALRPATKRAPLNVGTPNDQRPKTNSQQPTTNDQRQKKDRSPRSFGLFRALPPPRLPALIEHWAGKRNRNRFISRLQLRDAMLQLASRNLLHPLACPDFGEEIIGTIALEYQSRTAALSFFHRPAHQQARAG